MLTFSDNLLSPYLPLQIPRVNPKQARAYHRKPAISSFCQIATAERKAGHCAQRTRSICDLRDMSSTMPRSSSSG